MKILKYTFKVQDIDVRGDDLQASDEYDCTMHFSLLHKGHELFEKDYGKSVLSVLMNKFKDGVKEEDVANELLGDRFVRCLAAASYLKVVDGKVQNDAITQQEFKESRVNNIVDSDIEFVMQLISMTIDSLPISKGKGKDSGKK